MLDRLDAFEDVHGTACAEIVHDMAPGADILLAGFEDDVSWAQAVDQLAGAGVRIVSHSIGFDNLYPPDGNNYFTQKVDAAAAAGVLFVTAAGNEGQKYYSGAWRDANGNGFLEFGGGATELLPIGATAGGSQVVLRWDDGFGASNHDYDLLIVTAAFAGNPVLSARQPGDRRQLRRPAERSGHAARDRAIDVDEDQILYAVVVHDPASPRNAAQRFSLWSSGGVEGGFAVPDELALASRRRARRADGGRRLARRRRRELQLARPDGGRPREAGHRGPGRRHHGRVRRRAVLRDVGRDPARRGSGGADPVAQPRDEHGRAAVGARGRDRERRPQPQQRHGHGRHRPEPRALS